MKPDHPNPSTTQTPRFALGHVVATPDVVSHFEAHSINALDYLGRHACGDWGEVPPEDAALNELALAQNSRLLSRYTIAGKCVWLITEADRIPRPFYSPMSTDMRLEPKHVGDALAHRPARRLLQLLPLLVATPGQVVGYAHVEPVLLEQIADDADALMATLQMGVSAVGQLMAHAAPEVEDGTFSSDMVEALGWFLSEVSELSFTLMPLIASCRQHNADYAPFDPESMQPVFF